MEAKNDGRPGGGAPHRRRLRRPRPRSSGSSHVQDDDCHRDSFGVVASASTDARAAAEGSDAYVVSNNGPSSSSPSNGGGGREMLEAARGEEGGSDRGGGLCGVIGNEEPSSGCGQALSVTREAKLETAEEDPDVKSNDLHECPQPSTTDDDDKVSKTGIQGEDKDEDQAGEVEGKEEDTDSEDDDDDTDDRRRRLLSLLPPSMRCDASLASPSSCEVDVNLTTLTDREILEARTDIYGVASRNNSLCRLELAAQILDDALAAIPREEMAALSRAREAYPFLFVSAVSGYEAGISSHVRAFLEAEGYDPSRAARRMVRYWTEREKKMGDAAFGPDAFSPPSDEDVVRMIRRKMERSLEERLLRQGKEQQGEEEAKSSTCTSAHDDISNQLQVLTVIQDFQTRRLREVDRELARLPPHAREAWEDARSLRPDLADTDAHKVIFLHCVDYDARRAARRIANYWDMKYYLFGKDRAFEAVTVADLMDDDNEKGCKAELENGILHLLPMTDASGRGVLCFRGDKMMTLQDLSDDRIRVLRAAWYMLHAAQSNEEIYINGTVIINITDANNVNNFDYPFFLRMKTLMIDCVPLKCKALHDCVIGGEEESGKRKSGFSKLWISTIIKVISLVMGRLFRLRYVPHIGLTREEELANFEACGMAGEQLPEELGGTLDSEAFVKTFLEERRAVEEASRPSDDLN